MASMYSSNGRFWHVLLMRIVLVLAVTAVIVLAMPWSNAPNYRIEVGRPWVQAPVTAAFEFDVQKPDEVLQAERDSVTRLFVPYYDLNEQIAKNQIKRFLAHNRDGIEGLPKSFITVVAAKLKEVYEVGVMSQRDYSSLMVDTNAVVRVINGKVTKSVRVNQMLTPLTAYELFFADDQIANAKSQLTGCNINDYIVANVVYDSIRSNSQLRDMLSKIAPNCDHILNGQRIIDRGDIVTEKIALALMSYAEKMEDNLSAKSKVTTFWGRFLFVFMILGCFTLYLHLFRGDYFEKPRSLAMVYCLVAIFPIIISMMVMFNMLSVYVLPTAMLPMFIRVFLDSRTAFVAHVTMVLIAALVLSLQFEFVLIETVSGIVAIYTLRELSKRSQIFTAAFLTTVSAIIVYYATQLMKPGEELGITSTMVAYFVSSGVLLLLAYPLMFLVEKLFGFTSAVTLFELSDTNKDLLRSLSEVAPGTFQHSITVGNIASEIASRIGARSMLVRTGALYHDIGKMSNPVFFTENQSGVNPHDRMTPKESAQIIIGHITEGVKLAEKNGLPDTIRDFIITHHGAGMAKYFYITEKNAHPDEDIDTAPFTYPGPNPFTREQAILMMADSVEAASRSLKEYTEENITSLVNKIIDGQVNDGFFRECPITFRDIAVAKKVLIEKLKSIYHTRITYPELKDGTVGVVRSRD